MIWLTFCFFFIELSNDACFLFFSWTNCLHVFLLSTHVLRCMAFTTRCMEGVAKIPYKTFVDFVSISPTPPHPALQIGKQEESKREKRDTKVVKEVRLLQVCSPEGWAPEGVSLRVFPNLRRMCKVLEPSPFCKQLTLCLFPHFFLILLK